MSNAFLQLPTPVSNGVGPTVDVTSLSSTKTILVGGTFDAIVSIETSSDGGVTFGPAPYTAQGPKFQTIELSATHMRVRIAGLLNGVPVVFVGSAVTGTKAAVLDVPVGNGSGVPSDISDFSDWLSIVVSGSFGGTINIEVSDNGVNWSPLSFFNNAGIVSQSCFASLIRVTRQGVGFDPGLPAIAVAASDDSDASTTPGFTSPPIDITIFARTTGNDITGDGTLAKPYRTFQRSVLDVPILIPPGVFYTIDITGIGVESLPDNYALPPFESSWNFQFSPDGPITEGRTALKVFAFPQLVPLVPASDAHVEASDILSIVQDPVTSLITVTLIVPRASWAGNALQGKYYLGNVFAGDDAVIASSTASTVEFTTTFISAFFGFPFDIVEPSATLESGGFPGFSTENVNSIQFVCLGLNNRDGNYDIWTRNNATFYLYMCDIKDISIQGQPGFFNIITTCNWHDSTKSILFGNGELNFFGFTRNVLFNTFAFPPARFVLSEGAIIQNTILDDCGTFESRSPATTTSEGAMGYFTMFNTEIRNSKADAIAFHGNCGSIFDSRIRDSAGDAITFNKGAGVLQLTNVVGTGNTGVGVRVTDGGQVLADAATSVQGPLVTDGFKCGDNAAAAWAPGNYTDLAAANPTLSRVLQTP